MSQARFQKKDLERQRRARAAEKSTRKQERREAKRAQAPPTPTTADAAVLAQLALLHERFEAKQMTLEEFEVAKLQLTEHLDVT